MLILIIDIPRSTNPKNMARKEKALKIYATHQ